MRMRNLKKKVRRRKAREMTNRTAKTRETMTNGIAELP